MTAFGFISLSLLLVLPARNVFAGAYRQAFRLNSMRVSDVRGRNGPTVPKVPPPVDSGYDFRARPDYPQVYRTAMAFVACRDGDAPAAPQEFSLYDMYGARKMRLGGSMAVTIGNGKGRAEIVFPMAEFDGTEAEDRSALFVRLAGEGPSPTLSWAAVMCTGTRYLGYKGASLKLPGRSGNYSMDESLALGSQKALIEKTHPWLVAAGRAGRLCARDLSAKLKDYSVRTLPAELDGFNFKYDSARNALNITWDTAR